VSLLAQSCVFTHSEVHPVNESAIESRSQSHREWGNIRNRAVRTGPVYRGVLVTIHGFDMPISWAEGSVGLSVPPAFSVAGLYQPDVSIASPPCLGRYRGCATKSDEKSDL